MGKYQISIDGKNVNIYDLKDSLQGCLRDIYGITVKVSINKNNKNKNIITIDNVPENAQENILNIFSKFKNNKATGVILKINDIKYIANEPKINDSNNHNPNICNNCKKFNKLQNKINNVKKEVEHAKYRADIYLKEKTEIENKLNEYKEENKKLQETLNKEKEELNKYKKMLPHDFINFYLIGNSTNLIGHENQLNDLPAFSPDELVNLLNIYHKGPLSLISEKFPEIKSQEDINKINSDIINEEEINKLEKEAKNAQKELIFLEKLKKEEIPEIPETIKNNLISEIESKKDSHEKTIKDFENKISFIKTSSEIKKYADEIYKKYEIGKQVSEIITAKKISSLEVPVYIYEKDEEIKISVPKGLENGYISKTTERIIDDAISEEQDKRKIIEEKIITVEAKNFSIEEAKKRINEKFNNLPEEIKNLFKLKFLILIEK